MFLSKDLTDGQTDKKEILSVNVLEQGANRQTDRHEVGPLINVLCKKLTDGQTDKKEILSLMFFVRT